MRLCRFFVSSLFFSLLYPVAAAPGTDLVTTARAQTTAPADVQVKLSLAENKTVYRIGEPVRLVMEFTAGGEGYEVEFLPDRKERGFDTLVISPETGFTRWLDELHDNRVPVRDFFSYHNLSNSPERVDFIVNDRLRFDSAGQYTVSVITRRVTRRSSPNGPGDKVVVLSTNPVTFEVQPMSETDEAKEVKRLSDLLDRKRDPQTNEEVTKQLSYLTGEASTREKVRRFLAAEQRSGNYSGHVWYGLFIARNRGLVLKLVEAGLRDPNIPATTQILYTVTRLKTLVTHGVRTKPAVDVSVVSHPEGDPRTVEIRDSYVVELAAGLAKRTGNSQTTTAMTILSSLPKDAQVASAGLREVRRILVQQFDTLSPYNQEWLLRQYWDQLRDPALTPSFKKMLAASNPRYQVRQAALQRLLEVAPDEAPPYVIAEIRNPTSFVDPKILGALKGESLPEVDASLLEQIRTSTASDQPRARVYLKHKAALLVRFATESIYRELMDLYRSLGDKLPSEGRAGLLAYFAKHNEQEAIPLIEQAVSELKPGGYPAVLRDITELYYSKSIGAVLKKLLDTDDIAFASNAAYLIGRHGYAGDERVLEARLTRWQEEWRDRLVEADAQHQGRIERELIHALINGKSWKLSTERVRQLQTGCMTQLCKQSNPVRQ